MNNRRLARERAVQFLYQLDLNSSKEIEEELERFWDVHRAESFFDDKAKATWSSKEKQELPPPTLQDLAAKEDELTRPIIDRARKAINEVAKEGGYTYIFNASEGLLLYNEGGENIMPMVKKKLGIE